VKLCLVAALQESDFWSKSPFSSPFSKNEFSLLFAAIGLITVLAVVWAAFIRKPKDDSAHRYSYRRTAGLDPILHVPSGQANARATAGAPVEQPHKHKKRRRRAHRARNPTLAETGGLPPLRSDTRTDDPP
jgi:hypothetical protein